MIVGPDGEPVEHHPAVCCPEPMLYHEFVVVGHEDGWMRGDGATCATMACTRCTETRVIVLRPADAPAVRKMGFGASVPKVEDGAVWLSEGVAGLRPKGSPA